MDIKKELLDIPFLAIKETMWYIKLSLVATTGMFLFSSIVFYSLWLAIEGYKFLI